MPSTNEEYQELFDVYWPIGLAWIVLVWGLIVFLALRYRRRERKLPLPTQKHEAPLVETGYVVLLGLIAAFLVYLTFSTMSDVEANLPADSGNGNDEYEVRVLGQSAPEPDEVVNVTASRWNWRFDYPEHGITQVGTGTEIPELVVPQGIVQFRSVSLDVIHSFYIPGTRFKRDAFPQRVIAFTLKFDRPGYMPGECAEYCGLRHAYMKFNARVLPPDRYRRWVEARKGGARQRRFAAPGQGEPHGAFQEIEAPEGGTYWEAAR